MLSNNNQDQDYNISLKVGKVMYIIEYIIIGYFLS